MGENRVAGADAGRFIERWTLQADGAPFATPSSVLAPVGGYFARAAAVARSLLDCQQDIVVLHGDVHHGDVLHVGDPGWLAIDPKGIVGDRGFDFANILCNPDATLALRPGRLERQVAVIAAAAGLSSSP